MDDVKWTAQKEQLHAALNQLQEACGLGRSESGTEAMFRILYKAVCIVDDQWEDVVEKSHDDGLCYDVNALLVDALMDMIEDKEETI